MPTPLQKKIPGLNTANYSFSLDTLYDYTGSANYSHHIRLYN